MNPEGSVYKRCTCKDADGRTLGSKCPKLRRAGGGWHPTHGSWACQIELPVRTKTERRPFRRSGFDGRDAATELLDHVRSLLNLAGDDPDLAVQISDLIWGTGRREALPDVGTVTARIRAGVSASVPTTTAQYLTDWIGNRRGLSPNTMRSYTDHIRLYLVPHLGDIPIQNLKDRHITDMFTDLDDRNTAIIAAKASPDPAVRATMKGVRPVGPASMQRLLATLRKALNDCVRKAKLIPTNPALSIELPSGKPPTPKVWTAKAVARWQQTGLRPSPVMVWTPPQAGAFLDHAERHDIMLYPLFLLILHRGLRRGEAVGLRDFDVDLDDAVLTVAEQITAVGYVPIVKDVKSDAGERVMPLGASTITVLRDYVARRDRLQQVAGDDWPDTGLFFVRPDGKAWHPQTVSQRFDDLVEASGLPPVRLHDLRHCAATYLRAGGADIKEVQETLGHATQALTSDTYTSVLLEFQRAYADTVGDLIPRNPPAA